MSAFAIAASVQVDFYPPLINKECVVFAALKYDRYVLSHPHVHLVKFSPLQLFHPATVDSEPILIFISRPPEHAHSYYGIRNELFQIHTLIRGQAATVVADVYTCNSRTPEHL